MKALSPFLGGLPIIASATLVSAIEANSYSSESAVKESALSATNAFRSRYNAPALTWDDSLAGAAKTWASRCQWEHSGGASGENIAYGYPSVSAVIDTWGNEVSMYDFDVPTGFTKATGHFTQLVWKETTSLGCAAVDCTGKGSMDGFFVVCEYSPAGNIINEDLKLFRENVQRHISNEVAPAPPPPSAEVSGPKTEMRTAEMTVAAETLSQSSLHSSTPETALLTPSKVVLASPISLTSTASEIVPLALSSAISSQLSGPLPISAPTFEISSSVSTSIVLSSTSPEIATPASTSDSPSQTPSSPIETIPSSSVTTVISETPVNTAADIFSSSSVLEEVSTTSTITPTTESTISTSSTAKVDMSATLVRPVSATGEAAPFFMWGYNTTYSIPKQSSTGYSRPSGSLAWSPSSAPITNAASILTGKNMPWHAICLAMITAVVAFGAA